MCGVFGFIAKNGSGADTARLRRIAVETQRRGHHAFGLAWLGGDGRLHAFKRPGPATANLDDLEACHGAALVVGHCRWATHGAAEDNRNNHPHRAGHGWFVHNGVVENYAGLIQTHRLQPRTDCDSEVLGLLMAQFRGPLALRAARTAELAAGRLAVLGIWGKPGRLLIVRNGNPLYFGGTSAGLYFASQPVELPGRPTSIRDRYAGVIRFEGERLQHEAYQLD